LSILEDAYDVLLNTLPPGLRPIALAAVAVVAIIVSGLQLRKLWHDSGPKQASTKPALEPEVLLALRDLLRQVVSTEEPRTTSTLSQPLPTIIMSSEPPRSSANEGLVVEESHDGVLLKIYLSTDQLKKIAVAEKVVEGLYEVLVKPLGRLMTAVSAVLATTLVTALIVALFKDWMGQALFLTWGMFFIGLLSAAWILENSSLTGIELAKYTAKVHGGLLIVFLIGLWALFA
jgi:hypothetical protein